jgi:hypothetical protein
VGRRNRGSSSLLRAGLGSIFLRETDPTPPIPDALHSPRRSFLPLLLIAVQASTVSISPEELTDLDYKIHCGVVLYAVDQRWAGSDVTFGTGFYLLQICRPSHNLSRCLPQWRRFRSLLFLKGLLSRDVSAEILGPCRTLNCNTCSLSYSGSSINHRIYADTII